MNNNNNIEPDHIVMTPKKKTDKSTTLAIERQRVGVLGHKDHQDQQKVHVAGGHHQGIVINKQVNEVEDVEEDPAGVTLEFRVFLVSAQSGKHTHERRILQYWFKPDLKESNRQATLAQEFFRELVAPLDFPRDYVGFIKKIMKLLQNGFKGIRKIEVTLAQLDDLEAPPTRPLSSDLESSGKPVELTEGKVLELIESCFPNPVCAAELARTWGWPEEDILQHLTQLQNKGLVKALEHGGFTRVQQTDAKVQIVKQMPTMASSKQPTIAIITAQYCEKLAVDAMMENRETFVKYTTVGESNVYTLGCIGAHRVVSTKLPAVGHTREALTAAGNSTTRLLGTFQKVDYVFLVGVGGGVAHFTDSRKHVRLGDVVVGHNSKGKPIYVYCEKANTDENQSLSFEVKQFKPIDWCLQDIASQLSLQESEGVTPPWHEYISDGMRQLASNDDTEQEFVRPSTDTDKLYMALGERGVIEVAHPSDDTRSENGPRVHLGLIGASRALTRDDQFRQHFAEQYNLRAFDSEFDAVLESVVGNCRESFVCIRGIADYKEGARRSIWQPYAALAAAAVTKAIICGMEAPTGD